MIDELVITLREKIGSLYKLSEAISNLDVSTLLSLLLVFNFLFTLISYFMCNHMIYA